jgi:hypothetical protein
MKNRTKPIEIPEEDEELSPKFRRELERRITDAKNPVRYVVYSQLVPGSRWRLFLDVSSDGYWNTVEKATLFKRERVAQIVAKAYSEGKRRDLFVAKITTKNGKQRVLKYDTSHYRTNHRRANSGSARSATPGTPECRR